MKRLRCLLGFHQVLLDYSQCVQPHENVLVGNVIRRCARCGRTLPGSDPQPGDRARKEDLPPVMTYEEAGFYDFLGYAPERLYGPSR